MATKKTTKRWKNYQPHQKCVVLAGPYADDNNSQYEAASLNAKEGKLAVFNDENGQMQWQHVRHMLLLDATRRGMKLSTARATKLAKLVADECAARNFHDHVNSPTPAAIEEYPEGLQRTPLEVAMDGMTDAEVIAALARRQSTLGTLVRAHALVIKKSQDYNQGGMKDGREAARADRDNYFPFGHKSYIHMLHTKVQRLISLEAKADSGQGANFEGTYDTVLDVINYASFFGERLEREMGGVL